MINQKTMKTKIFTITLLCGTLAMLSCSDFLTEDSKGRITSEKYFASQEDLDGAVNVLYSRVQRSINSAHTLAPNWMGDDITALPGGNKNVFREFDTYMVNNNNADTKNAWNANYSIIKAANFIINNVERVPVNEEEKNIGRGQALFWRSVAYFKLVRWFGSIPLVLNTDIDFNIGKTTIEAVYERICTDLEEAERILPTQYNTAPRFDNLNNYVNKGAAQAVLAAVYMARAGYPLRQEQYYKQAAEMAKKVIDGVKNNDYYYKLEDTYKKRFNYVSNPYSLEGVVAVKFNKDNPWGWSGLDSQHSACQAYESVTNGGWGDAVAEIKFWKEMPDGPRKDAIYGSNNGQIYVEKNTYMGKKINWYLKTGDDFIVSEAHPMFRTLLYGGGKDGNTMSDYDDSSCMLNNGICSQTLYMISYSEVLLWYAEAQARSGTIPSDAVQALQQVLDRAYGKDKDDAQKYADPTAFANKCLREHGYEVAGYYPALVARSNDQLRMDDLKNSFIQRQSNTPVEVEKGIFIAEGVQVTGAWSDERNYAAIPLFDSDLNDNLK